MASEQASAYLKKIKQALETISEKIPKKVAKNYSQHAQEIATQAIENFYASYDPIKYKRTGNLFNLVDGVDVNANGLLITIGFSSSYMTNYRHDSADYVSTGAFQYGIHGTSAIYVSSPTPAELFYKNSMKFINDAMITEVENYLKEII